MTVSQTMETEGKGPCQSTGLRDEGARGAAGQRGRGQGRGSLRTLLGPPSTEELHSAGRTARARVSTLEREGPAPAQSH